MGEKRPRVGISACLLGHKVRHDGGHKRDPFVTEVLGRFVDWVPVCPELEVGMGVPRETVRLVGRPSHPHMVAQKSGKDWTREMTNYARERLVEIERLKLSGYIFKKDSPSCGLERVKVYGEIGAPSRKGRGLFARALTDAFPLLPVEEEGRLNDPGLRENFLERLFAYHRWRRLLGSAKSVASLVQFHASHKLLLLSHSERHTRRLGRIVAEAKKSPLGRVLEDYGHHFMEALAVHVTLRTHTNVLQHMMGYLSDRLTPDERGQLGEAIIDYHKELVSLAVPLTLIRHYVKKHRVAYILNQVYLKPYPRELRLT